MGKAYKQAEIEDIQMTNKCVEKRLTQLGVREM